MRIKTGGTIGILGGGQLARMLCQAAGDLGFQTAVFCPDENPPSKQFCTTYYCHDYSDLDALEAFATTSDVITCEFENVSAATLEALSGFGAKVRPCAKAFSVAQDRLVEKAFLQDIGIQTAKFLPVNTLEDAQTAFHHLGAGILKTRRFGYDGRGQFRIFKAEELLNIDYSDNPTGWIYEQFVSFSHEISVILARSEAGDIAHFPISTNIHKGGILRTSIVPSPETNAETQEKAISFAKTLADALGYCGTIAVEYFITDTGKVLANEFAPRVHNSGHWTRELCSHDQFTLHILAITGQLPQGLKPQLLNAGTMHNIIGDEITGLETTLPANARLTLYGKTEARTGRKMGHYVVANSVTNNAGSKH